MLKQPLAITIDLEEIKAFCQRWKIKEFYLFVAVLQVFSIRVIQRIYQKFQ